MAKYRGKHNGKTRGKYVRAMLTSSLENRESWFEACQKIKATMVSAHMGKHVISLPDYYYETDNYLGYIASFHLAGASVGLDGISYHNENNYKDKDPHRIDLNIISNDEIEDVLKKIESVVPYSLEHLNRINFR